MGKMLVIVESPAKAKTINKYLGNQYIVKSSVGHITDIAEFEKEEVKGNIPPLGKLRKTIQSMGINPWDDWRINYRTMKDKKKVIDELKLHAKNADVIYLATDLDREGEAIAWHLQELLKGYKKPFKRVTFSEITKKAIQEAFEHPRDVDMDNVDSQQARRVIDRTIGFMLSPLLWERIARGLSAGRVQSVATRLIVEREEEIENHIPEEYWDITASVYPEKSGKHDTFTLSLKKYNGTKSLDDFKRQLVDKEFRDKVEKTLRENTLNVDNISEKRTSSKPKGPFTTSTLQQAASTFLGYGVKRTMGIAQKLYENGYITYMRTDSMNISQDALDAVRQAIVQRFGSEYLSDAPNVYASRQDAQEAHEAIRPSNMSLTPDQLENVEDDARRLYKLIMDRFFACQMKEAVYDVTELLVTSINKDNGIDALLNAQGRVEVFAGWTKAFNHQVKDDKYQPLPKVSVGDSLTLEELFLTQKFTKPVARYNEASLVKELEKRGIGRPSTYATIISTIAERNYATLENKRFTATKMGQIVTRELINAFPLMMDYRYTRQIEEQLDKIATHQLELNRYLTRWFFGSHPQVPEGHASIQEIGFFDSFMQASKSEEEGGMRVLYKQTDRPIYEDIPCPQCGSPMTSRMGKEGYFLGCSTYNKLKKDNCKGSLNLLTPDEKPERKTCPVCNGKMDGYRTLSGDLIYLCRDALHCNGHLVVKGVYPAQAEHLEHEEMCPTCNVHYLTHSGRFGAYVKCPQCNTIRGLNPDGSLKPPKKPAIPLIDLPCDKHPKSHYVLREGERGPFLTAHNFPKVREIRSPYIKELIRYQDKLPDTLTFYLTAPEVDSQGYPTLTKWRNKTNEPLVVSLDPKTNKYAEVYVYRHPHWVKE